MASCTRRRRHTTSSLVIGKSGHRGQRLPNLYMDIFLPCLLLDDHHPLHTLVTAMMAGKTGQAQEALVAHPVFAAQPLPLPPLQVLPNRSFLEPTPSNDQSPRLTFNARGSRARPTDVRCLKHLASVPPRIFLDLPGQNPRLNAGSGGKTPTRTQNRTHVLFNRLFLLCLLSGFCFLCFRFLNAFSSCAYMDFAGCCLVQDR